MLDTIDTATSGDARKNLRRVTFTCGYRELSAALDRCQLSVSTEETRYYLCGIFLELSLKTGVRLVSTDGHRLTAWELKTAGLRDATGLSYGRDVGVILERKAARNLAKLLRKRKQPVTVEVETWQEDVWTPGQPTAYPADRYAVHVDIYGLGRVAVDGIDGTYPDWRRVMPRLDRKAAELSFDARQLREALEPLKSKTDRGQQFKVESSGLETTLTAAQQDPIWGDVRHQIRAGKRRGEWVTRKEVVGYNAHTVTRRIEHLKAWNITTCGAYAGFNVRYVLDLIPARGRVTLRGEIGRDYGGPWRIECENEPEATIIIMPCRV